MELTLNGTKGRMGQNIEWKKRRMEKTPNGTKCQMEKHRMGQNVEWKNSRMGQNVECKNTEWDKMSNGNMERKICGFLLLLSDYMGTAVLHTDTLDTICIIMSKKWFKMFKMLGEMCVFKMILLFEEKKNLLDITVHMYNKFAKI
jgi:hypothetical protein